MILGIDIGGTNVKFGIFDQELHLLHAESSGLDKINTQETFFDYIVNSIHSFAEKYPIRTVGIGIPGLINNDLILEKSPNLKFLEGTPLIAHISERISIPAYIENDANVAAMSEFINNDYQTIDYVYLTLGTGIGGAIVINNNIFRGTLGFAGEIGHMIINSEFDEALDNYRTGTLEFLAGKVGITKLYQSLSNSYEEIGVEDIDTRVTQGDLIAQKTFDIIGFHISSAILSIINLISIPNFIIGGGISKSLYLLKKIEQFVKQRALLNDYDRINIKAAKHSEQAGIFGAAFMANKYYKQVKDEQL